MSDNPIDNQRDSQIEKRTENRTDNQTENRTDIQAEKQMDYRMENQTKNQINDQADNQENNPAGDPADEATEDAGRSAFADFAGGFSRDISTGLMMLYDYIVERQVIPYKIQKDRSLEIMVAGANAFYYSITFHNVIIEDGRHPREILLTKVSGECAGDSATGRFRIRFVNGLITDGTAKESAFTFDKVSTELKLWNYNYLTCSFTEESDKLPWRILYEPMAELVNKWKILGEMALSAYEIENAILFELLMTFLGMYLDSGTTIGYGRSSLTYDKEKLANLPVTKRMLRAGRRLFEQCGWTQLAGTIESFGENRAGIFTDFVMKITNREGKAFYDHMTEMIKKCSDIYPMNPEVEALKNNSSRYQIVREGLNALFRKNGYKGSYPDFSIREKPAFIETSFVYERKYTYINEKQKLHLYSFIESYVDGGILICAVSGKALEGRSDERTLPNQAIQCYFSNDGRRSAGVTESLYFTEDMPVDELKADIVTFFKRCI